MPIEYANSKAIKERAGAAIPGYIGALLKVRSMSSVKKIESNRYLNEMFFREQRYLLWGLQGNSLS